MSKVLVVEADRRLIHDLRAALKSEGFEVVIAHSGVEALKAMRTERPDIVILDPTLAWLGNTQGGRTPPVGARGAGPPILVLSPKGEHAGRVSAIDIQAAGPVVKFSDAKDVVAHLKLLRRRAPFEPGEIVRAGLLEVDMERWTVSMQGRIVTLTAKEFGLLRMLLNAKGRVLTRGVLRQTVWGPGASDRFGSRTVDVHIGRLRRKLGIAGRYIVTVRGVGYRLGVSPESLHRNRKQDG